MTTRKCGRPKALNPKTHRYYFKLDDQQDARFRQMLSEADSTANVSRFILARLFG